LSRTLAGGASGLLAENLGYAQYFFLTFLLAIPAFMLLPWIRGVSRSD
jgi:MFS transporter, PAT family, beta-lactamase induction signal transducer AmpG